MTLHKLDESETFLPGMPGTLAPVLDPVLNVGVDLGL